MLEEDSEEIRSYHACDRRDCTRIFRAANGYSDVIDHHFDESRAASRECPRCGAVLYLAEVDHGKKIETWECPRVDCEHKEESRSPSGR